MTKSGRVLSGKPVVFFFIPVDFCTEFWNSTFSPVLEYTEEIFLTASARAFDGANPGCVCFCSKFIQVFFWPTQFGHTVECQLSKLQLS